MTSFDYTTPCDCADEYHGLSRPQIEGIAHALTHRVKVLEDSEGYRWRLEWTELAKNLVDEYYDLRDALHDAYTKIDRLEAHAAQCAHWQANRERADARSMAPLVNNESSEAWKP